MIRTQPAALVRLLALLVCAGSVAVATAAPPAAPAGDTGDHRASTAGGQTRNEPSVAVDPRDARRVATAANDYASPSVGVYLSSDGGRTFATRDDPPALPRTRYGSDPHLAYLGGDLLAAYLSYSGSDHTAGGLVVARRSTTKGTWSVSVVRRNTQVPALCRFADFPALAVDRRPGKRVAHVAWQEIVTSGGDCRTYVRTELYAARSTDGGRTWSRPVALPSPRDRGYLPSIAVGPGGEVYVTFDELVDSAIGAAPCPTGNGLVQSVVARSGDGGRGFTRHVVQQACLPQPPLAFLADAVGAVSVASATGATYRLPASSNTVVDPRTGHLTSVLGGSDTTSLQQRVYVASSSDGGRRWTSRALPPVEAGENQQFPRLAVGPDGRLSLLWIAQLPGGLLRASHAWSLDGARTWRPVQRIAAVPSRVNNADFLSFIGDYLANEVGPDGRAHPVWTDLRESQGLSGGGTTYTRALVP